MGVLATGVELLGDNMRRLLTKHAVASLARHVNVHSGHGGD
jgi:hypothetical protein